MSKTEILDELPKLESKERHEILEYICELEETELHFEEEKLIDQRLMECRNNPNDWSRWSDVKSRILSRFYKS